MQNQTKYYFGSYEITIKADTITEYCRLPGGAVYKTTNGRGELLFTYTDHLGSITHITDDEGNLLAEQSFDAWGRMRNPETWEYTSEGAAQSRTLTIVNGRGYTGHEMLPTFALINMNGRLYDPVLGRMLSPDNYIQAPDYTQNFNRYSYVLNNPLKYVDIDGQNPLIIIPIVIGMYLGGVATNQGELNPIQWNWVDEGAWKTYTGIVGGGILGYIGGWYILNPGNLQVAASIITPLGTVGMVGQGSDWSFQWTTNAGGGGSVPIGDNKQQNTSVMVNNQIEKGIIETDWTGYYFPGSEEHARKILIYQSKKNGVEMSLWSTSKGFYFEQKEGNAYYTLIDWDYVLANDIEGLDDVKKNPWQIENYNLELGYRYNTNYSSERYIPVRYEENNLYIYPQGNSIMTRGRVYFHAHTHFNYPGSVPGPSGEVNNSLWSYGDKFFVFKLEIRAKIYDIQGKIWYY